MRVVILGASGMLGSMMLEVLAGDPGLEMTATLRGDASLPLGVNLQGGCHLLDAASATVSDLVGCLAEADWAINCIGVIKTHIHDTCPMEVQRAIRVNGLFPHLLAEAGARTGCRVLQIATDCVYAGTRGRYREGDPHDALDVYGKTKSLGEVRAPGFHNLRCSIIGPERKEKRSLLEWFLGHREGATVTGYLNHHWNGVTTLQFARICRGILAGRVEVPGLTHVVPADVLSKAALLQVCAEAFGRRDLRFDLREVPEAVDRSLATNHPDLNRAIWRAAGYPEPPTLAAMVEELAQACRSERANTP